MSVIVKNMEMPKSCSKCGWFDMGGGYGYRCTLLRKSFDMWNKISIARDKDCPLIELPPHGNLKDESDIISLIEVMFCKDKDGMEHAIQCVNDAPTVIEGSETDA